MSSNSGGTETGERPTGVTHTVIRHAPLANPKYAIESLCEGLVIITLTLTTLVTNARSSRFRPLIFDHFQSRSVNDAAVSCDPQQWRQQQFR